MAHDVFISHSAKDKTIADAVCAALESEGVRCWIAPRDVMPGMEWGRSIIEAIEQAKIMILLFTANSNTSSQIRREVERAVNHDVVILPFRVENILPDKSLEYFIGNVHWLDALTPPLEKHIERLVGTVKSLLSQTLSKHGQPPVGLPVVPSEPVAAPAAQARAVVELPLGSIAPQPPTRAWRAGRRMGRAWKVLATAALILVAAFLIGRWRNHWSALRSGTSKNLASIFGTGDGKRLWAVGAQGTVIESDDGGTTWMARNSGTEADLLAIFGTSDGSRLWAAGVSTILESDDGGSTWMSRKSGTPSWLESIFGTSDGKRLWVVGFNGTILESVDGGAAWTPRSFGTQDGLFSIFGTGDGSRLWAVGGSSYMAGTIVESDDGGATWIARGESYRLHSIFATGDGRRLWAVGDGGRIVDSDNGGGSWYARFPSIWSKYNSIFGTGDGKNLWVVGDAGTILESDDEGASWTERVSGTTNNLNSVFGTGDGKHLWAVGERGTILEHDSLW